MMGYARGWRLAIVATALVGIVLLIRARRQATASRSVSTSPPKPSPSRAAMDAPVSSDEKAREYRARGPWARAASRLLRKPLAVFALLILLGIFAAAAFAEKIAPHDYSRYDFETIMHAPTLKGRHFFGTDEIGRDLFSRTLYAIQTSVEVSLAVALLATLIGIVVGALAGYFGGWIDNALMRLVDFVVTIPALVVLFVAIVYFGSLSPLTIAAVLALYLWTTVARVVRASFASLREMPFVEAARAAGASDLRIVLRHLLPNAAGAVIVAATLLVGQVILLETTVEFFGYGLNQTTELSLGNLVAAGLYNRGGFSTFAWWLYTLPALVIVVIIVCVNIAGDSLDEALAPMQPGRSL